MNEEQRNPFKRQESKVNKEQYSPFEERIIEDENPIINQHENVFETQSRSVKPKRKINPWMERLKGVGIIVLFYAVQLLASVFFGVLVVINNHTGTIMSVEEAGPILRDMFTGMMLAEGVLILGILIVYNKRVWFKIKDALGSIMLFIFKIFVYYILLTMASVVFSAIDAKLFSEYSTNVGENQALIEAALLTPSLAMIISICLTAPIVEEFVFRYGIIKKLLYGMNKYIAAVVAALIFSFAHIGFSQMADPALFVHLMLSYIGPALVFAIVYVREDNLIYPITVHIINNAQAIIIIMMLANAA